MKPEHTFESILGDLLQAKVNFILVGGLAVELCGFTRATLDVDILIEDSEVNVLRLIDSLKDFADGESASLTMADFSPEEGCIRIVDEFALDIFTRMTGRSYDDLLPLAAEYQHRLGSLKYLSAEGLILLKKDSLRPKDQIDVLELKALQPRTKD